MPKYSIRRISSANQQEMKTEKELINIYSFMYEYYKDFYPNFTEWFNNKVIKDFYSGDRTIYLVENSMGNNYYGVSIVRKSLLPIHVNKICSFLLLNEARDNGLGTELMNMIIDDLSIDNFDRDILITVPEERLFESYTNKNLYHFLSSYNFSLIRSCRSKYRLGRVEYILKKTVLGVSHEDKRNSLYLP